MNIIFNFFLVWVLFWIYVNNFFGNYKLSIFILLFLVIFFLNFFIYIRKYLLILVFIILGFWIWIFISFLSLKEVFYKEKILSNFLDNKKYNVEFTIKDINKVDNKNIEYIAKINRIIDKKVDKKILSIIVIPNNFKLNIWDIIESKVKLYNFKNTKKFYYKNYMLSKNIFCKAYINDFSYIWKEKQYIFLEKIRDIRQKLIKTIHYLYPEKEAIFLAWILLWARENLPDKLKREFNNSWLTHFIAVSGFNITILIAFFSIFLKYFPAFIRFILMSLFIIIFVFLVWFSIPVIRAAIMWILAYFVFVSWRKASLFTLILLTAFFIVINSPLSLNYDVSLHLSFLAVLWIVYTQKFFEKVFDFLPEFLAIKEAFVLTLSALSFTLPVMIFDFWQVSIMAPLANISVTWTIPIAMLLWFVSIIVYFVYNPLSWIIAYFTWILLKWDIMSVEFFGNLKWALLKTDFWEYSNYLKLIYFLALIFIVIYFWNEKKEAKIEI